jgi:hypothetical protein
MTVWPDDDEEIDSIDDFDGEEDPEKAICAICGCQRRDHSEAADRPGKCKCGKRCVFKETGM